MGGDTLKTQGGRPNIGWMDNLIMDEHAILVQAIFSIYALFALDDHHG